mmetsp:Transcript_41452/g.125522  ORF Transcript_41452/g.125522 Transcript_41452/m.125522 type:complete len:86 (+) Transcript_41452:397-654(+)
MPISSVFYRVPFPSSYRELSDLIKSPNHPSALPRSKSTTLQFLPKRRYCDQLTPSATMEEGNGFRGAHSLNSGIERTLQVGGSLT